jgi:hypothetical protein
MCSPAVYNAYKNFLIAFQDKNGKSYPVLDYDSIEPAIQQGNEPFLVLNELYSDAENTSIGTPLSKCMLEIGEIEIQCFVPSPESHAEARELCQEVRTAIRNLRDGDVVAEEPSPPSVDVMNEGLWSVAVTSSPYEYYYYT